MEIISSIALILLSLVGYSGGAVSSSGKTSEPKPSILDLFLIVLVWAAAIYAKLTFPINRWLLIFCFLAVAFLIAVVASIILKRKPDQAEIKEPDQSSPSPSLWDRWKTFSKRLGSFQSRSLLSLFYFIITFPFALGVKFFSDPLRLKHKKKQSYWLSRKALHSAQDDFRKQF